MGKKRLTINLVSNLVSYAVATLVSFFLTPFLVNNLGKEVYGFYGLANNVVSYITVISIALNSMAAKYITVELVRGNKVKANQYYSSIFFSNVLLSVFLVPILAFIIFNIQKVFDVSDVYLNDVKILFALVFGAMLLNLIGSVFGCATYTTNRVDLRGYTNFAKAILRVILYVSIFAVFKPSIIYVGIVALCLEMFNTTVQIVLKRKLSAELEISRRFFDYKLVWDSLKIGVWNSLNHLGDLMLSSSDLMIANILLGEGAGGDISIIKTLPSLLSGVITAVNGVFMPRITTRYAENNCDKLVELGQRVMGFLTTPIVVVIIIYGKEFFNLWVPGNDSDLLMRLSAIDVSRMMLIGVVWPVSNLNIVRDKIKTPSLLVILIGVLNIYGVYLLIKFTNIGIFAIPITTLILTIAYYGIFIPLYPCKEMRIKWTSFIFPIVEMMVSASLISISSIIIKGAFMIESWKSLILSGGLSGIVALFISSVVFFKPSKITITLKNVIMHNRVG
jgi:O-antigen/teichoic acid export membrane protein